MSIAVARQLAHVRLISLMKLCVTRLRIKNSGVIMSDLATGGTIATHVYHKGSNAAFLKCGNKADQPLKPAYAVLCAFMFQTVLRNAALTNPLFLQ